jgi:WD40 repeat protein
MLHFAIFRDGRILAAGGRSRFIHLWDLDTHRLLRIVELPTKVTSVKQLSFLPDKFDAGQNQVCFKKNMLFQNTLLVK